MSIPSSTTAKLQPVESAQFQSSHCRQRQKEKELIRLVAHVFDEDNGGVHLMTWPEACNRADYEHRQDFALRGRVGEGGKGGEG